MPRPPRDVTDAELSVLQHLWDAGAASVRELADRLYPGGAASEYATVQKLLDRLEAKGCVRRIELDASPRRFTAAVAREDLIDRRLRAMADQLCGGSLLPLVNQGEQQVRSCLDCLPEGRHV